MGVLYGSMDLVASRGVYSMSEFFLLLTLPLICDGVRLDGVRLATLYIHLGGVRPGSVRGIYGWSSYHLLSLIRPLAFYISELPLWHLYSDLGG